MQMQHHQGFPAISITLRAKHIGPMLLLRMRCEAHGRNVTIVSAKDEGLHVQRRSYVTHCETEQRGRKTRFPLACVTTFAHGSLAHIHHFEKAVLEGDVGWPTWERRRPP